VHTIGAQITEAIQLHQGVDKAEARRRAIEALRQVHIDNPERAVDRYPFQYSGGMRQRAMIAMALSCQPDVLIADEPTTALDVTTQAEILKLIKELQRLHGMAVLFITHDMGVVAEIADEVVVMRDGRVVEAAEVHDAFERPRHKYTRTLIHAARVLEAGEGREDRSLPDPGPATEEPLLAARDLSLAFHARSGRFGRERTTTSALQKVSFDLRAGEALGVVGESGSGKTTLGRVLMGMYRVDAGTAAFRLRSGQQRDLTQPASFADGAVYRDIRMIFQDPYSSLNPRMTVEQIIAEPLRLQGLARGRARRDRVAELLERVGLQADMMDRYPHAFSGGQRQRIGIARAIAVEPRLVIADEATSALDGSIRAQILDLLLKLRAELGLSFIFIAHDIGVVRYFCDRVAVMHRGAVVELGTAAQICDAPTHPYTQRLLAAVPYPDPRRRKLSPPLALAP
jgi:peptide/nickel transport system ATP-binding protein